MSLSQDIKIMLHRLKNPTDDNLEKVIAILMKWDKVHDEFYAKCAEDAAKPVPLEIRRRCPCYQAAKSNGGPIGETNQQSCFSCRLRGGHGEHCDQSDEYGCEYPTFAMVEE